MISKTIRLINSNEYVYNSLINIFNCFWNTHKKEVYLVGGIVRDLLLNKQPKDYDLCTNASLDEIREICKELNLKTFDSGIKHGTLTIIDDKYNISYEITAYRKDGEYTDGRHPDSVEFVSSLEEDLKRRDFTINSFAYNLLTHQVNALNETYFNDLACGIIRAVGNADTRFKEDALRMLRAIRFSAQLDFVISANTFNSIIRNNKLIKQISFERIRDELTKILLSDKPDKLSLLITTGLDEFIWGEENKFLLTKMNNTSQNNQYHYADVFNHTLDVIKAVLSEFNLRWAALLHDTGKITARTVDENGYDHFYEHPDKSAEIVLNISNVLKFSNEQRDTIYNFVKYHDSPIAGVKKSTLKRLINLVGKDIFLDYLELRDADLKAHNTSNISDIVLNSIGIAKKMFNEICEESEALSLKDLAINGDIIVADGTLHGKEIGDCLNWLLGIVIEFPEENTKEKLLHYFNEYKLKFKNS